MAVVLIAEDDGDIAEILELYLGSEGFEVRVAHDGREALGILKRESIDAMLVDIMMPLLNGFDFIKAAREVSDAPIIVVSARSDISDKTLGLGLGADGYVTKPFDPLEVVALVKALLRRYNSSHSANSASSASSLVVGSLELDTDSLVLRKDGEVVPLTASELKIMAKLMKHPGRVFTKAQLYEVVNGTPCLGGDESVMVHISNIRSKLGTHPEDGEGISTVRGLGYRLDG